MPSHKSRTKNQTETARKKSTRALAEAKNTTKDWQRTRIETRKSQMKPVIRQGQTRNVCWKLGTLGKNAGNSIGDTNQRS